MNMKFEISDETKSLAYFYALAWPMMWLSDALVALLTICDNRIISEPLNTIALVIGHGMFFILAAVIVWRACLLVNMKERGTFRARITRLNQIFWKLPILRALRLDGWAYFGLVGLNYGTYIAGMKMVMQIQNMTVTQWQIELSKGIAGKVNLALILILGQIMVSFYVLTMRVIDGSVSKAETLS